MSLSRIWTRWVDDIHSLCKLLARCTRIATHCVASGRLNSESALSDSGYICHWDGILVRSQITSLREITRPNSDYLTLLLLIKVFWKVVETRTQGESFKSFWYSISIWNPFHKENACLSLWPTNTMLLGQTKMRLMSFQKWQLAIWIMIQSRSS